MADNHHSALAKLDSTNYMVWATRMEDHLVGKDLLEAISTDFLSNTPLPDDLRKDRKALALPRTYVSDSLIHFMSNTMTAADASLLLSDLHLLNSYSRIRGLIKAVTRLSLLRGEVINDYIVRAMALQIQLRSANEPVSEMIIITSILGGLPREYITIVAILEAEDSTLTISSIQAKLCAMEQSIRDNRITFPDATALSAGSHCEHCRKPGHSSDQCWTKYPTKRPAHLPPTIPTTATAFHAGFTVPEHEEMEAILDSESAKCTQEQEPKELKEEEEIEVIRNMLPFLRSQKNFEW
jgi:hypothetical protein